MNIFLSLAIGLSFTLIGAFIVYSILVDNLWPFLAYKKSTIANVQSGEKVYIAGRFSPGKTVISPVTQTNCLFWRVCVTEKEERIGREDNNITKTLLEKTSKDGFSITDHSATIEVLPMSKQNLDKAINSSNWGKPFYKKSQNLIIRFSDPRILAFLNKHHIKYTHSFMNSQNLTVREYLWQAGNPVYVAGEVIEQERYKKAILPTLILHKRRLFVFAFLVFQLIFGLLFFGIGVVILGLLILSLLGY